MTPEQGGFDIFGRRDRDAPSFDGVPRICPDRDAIMAKAGIVITELVIDIFAQTG